MTDMSLEALDTTRFAKAPLAPEGRQIFFGGSSVPKSHIVAYLSTIQQLAEP